MRLFHIKNKDDFAKEISEEKIAAHMSAVNEFIPPTEKSFVFNGYSLSADQNVDFYVDFLYGKYPTPNWRERVVCPISKLNNRNRYADFIVDTYAGILSSDIIYIMEQTTPFYRHLRSKYKNIIGSEFISPKLASGYINPENILHQDATKLSFEDETFKAVLSFDVLEHIPDYLTALKETYRVLERGGKLIFTAPFNNKDETTIRAIITETGDIKHILEPEYHGDPMSKEGVLCYYHFGWDIIDSLLKTGFTNAYAVVGYSLNMGFIGPQLVFIGEKY